MPIFVVNFTGKCVYLENIWINLQEHRIWSDPSETHNYHTLQFVCIEFAVAIFLSQHFYEVVSELDCGKVKKLEHVGTLTGFTAVNLSFKNESVMIISTSNAHS